MKLSIIICVYNTPKEYLSECLESITRSTVKSLKSDYEICMVDDGSTVDYSDIIGKYNLKVKKTENRGIFAARKTGAEMAVGEYSIYCDSDDTVSFNYYLPMVEKAETCGADIVINDWATHTQRARYYAKKDETIYSDIDVGQAESLPLFVKNEGRQHSFFVLWNKLYKTELLLSAFNFLTSLSFDSRSSYSEDAALNFFIWKEAKRIVNIHTGYYFYRIHPTQSVIAKDGEKLRRQITSMSKTLKIMRENIGEIQDKEKIICGINAWANLMARSHYSQAKSEGFTELYPYISESYEVEKLRISTAKDGADYEKKVLLGDNFSDVENALISAYDSLIPVRCEYSASDKYTAKCVNYLKSIGKITEDENAPLIVIPKIQVSLKKRIIHNFILHKIGLVLFKKGSKSREFLKKFF